MISFTKNFKSLKYFLRYLRRSFSFYRLAVTTSVAADIFPVVDIKTLPN